MKPPPFRYLRVTTLAETLDAMTEAGDEAKILAGGQSLIAMMNLRLVHPELLIDINRLADLDYIRQKNGTLAIGALCRQAAIEESSLVAEQCPLMAEAIKYVAHKPIRNRGTIGGNLAHADPTSELPAVALTVEAEFQAQSSTGQRTISADDFFVGHLTTSLEPDELLTEIRVAAWPKGQGWSFMELSPRKGDYALVGVAATLQLQGETCTAARLAYTGVGEHAQRIPAAEQALIGQPAGGAAFREAADIASRQVDPSSDVHATAEYRRDLVNVLTRRALAQALARCEKGA